MNRNIKIVFFVLTFLTILLSTSIVSAIDESDSNVLSEKIVEADVTSDCNIAQTDTCDNTINTNNIEKTDKKLKKDSLTINEVEYSNKIENQTISTTTTINENTFMNNCTVEISGWDGITNNAILYINNSNINCYLENSQTSTLYINNTILGGTVDNSGNMLIYNTTLNGNLTNNGNLTISDDSSFGDNFKIGINNGEIIINDSAKIIPHLSEIREDATLENMTLLGDKINHANLTLINCQLGNDEKTCSITNYGNLTLINTIAVKLTNYYQNIYVYNSTLNGTLTNRGNLTLADDVIFTSSFALTNYGNIFVNDTNMIYPYINTFKGNNRLHDIVIDKAITNDVQSNLTLSNATLNARITNRGTLIINDDCSFGGNFQLSNNGNIEINDTNKIYPYINTFTGQSKLSNLIIDKRINNNGNMTLSNVTISSTINNNGILIIEDDCSFTENTVIYDYGQIIINDTTKIAPYLSTYNGEYTIVNTTIRSSKVNNGDLTVINSSVEADIYNYGTLDVKNSVLNGYIQNEGTLIIDDETVFGNEFYLEGEGEIITNNTDAIIPYLSIYNGNYTITDTEFEEDKANYGELTIINSALYNYFENYGTMTVINSLLDGSIYNDGVLNISDDCELGDNLEISGQGQIIYSNIKELIAYLDTLNGNYTLENIVLDSPKTNNGNLTVKNSTLDAVITNNGVLNISDDCEFGDNFQIRGSGEVLYDDFNKIMPHLATINGNYTFENMNISRDITFYGNIELINCNIKAKITNHDNLTIINSSLSNNNMNVASSNEVGFLIYNLGNLNLRDCIAENNTFDTTITYYYSGLRLYGAIVNNGNMSIENGVFNNNKLGHYFAESYNNYYGNSFGNGSIVFNNGFLTVNNSNFTNNHAGSYGGAIVSVKNLTIDNCIFEDNTAVVGGGAIALDRSQAAITNTNFKRNNATLKLTINDLCGGGAIYATNGEMTIDNCIFDDNLAICHITGLAGVNSKGGSLALLNMKSNITNSTFKNHQKEVIQGGYLYATFNMNATISDCLFENNKGGIIDYTSINIINNTFKNTTGEEVINNLRTISVNKTISGNKFINNNVTTETINTYIYYDNTILNLTEADNTYQNTSINDTLEVNIPDEIYEGQDITITGTYTINNPENYDSNILEQNKFNLYINGELKEILDELSFTVTPTSGTMIIGLQPTISQTRKTISISSTTLSDITITPDNYDDYIYDGTLIGVSKGKIATFTGQFNNKGEIYVDTSGIILNGEDATFTNTIFTLDADNITLRNMRIDNSNTEYPISNYGTSNTITNNTITITKDEGKIAAIKNVASNTAISDNILIVSGPANTIDFSETSQADTQAILLLGGDNNKIINNTLTVDCSGINTMYGTIEGITNSEGATNTIITQNNINVTGANFNYGINCLVNDENLTITENNILVTGERYCDGVQVGNGVKNIVITDNNITCICINTTVLEIEGAITYGVIASNMGSSQSDNITVNNNNINITGTANYAIEYYQVNNTRTNNNNITVNGPFSMGIAYSYSPNGIAVGNNIITSGDCNTPINYITEEVKQENTGIRIQNGTQNITIENNTIATSDIALNDSTIHSDVANVTIKDNILSSSTKVGDASLIVPSNAIVLNNSGPEGTTPDDEHEWTTIIITPDNLNNYFDWNGFRFDEYTKAIFQGSFTNVETAGYGFTTNNLIIDGTDAIFVDTVFSIQKNNITLQNINLTSNNQYSRLIMANKGENIKFINSTITLNNTKTIDDIYAQWGIYSPLYSQCIRLTNINGLYVENNTINVYGPAIEEVKPERYYIANTYAIEVYNSSNININNNIISVENSTEATEESILNAVVLVNTTDVKICNNTITVSKAVVTTAINNTSPLASDVIKNNTITENPIVVPTIIMEDVLTIMNMPTTITATLTDNDGNAINEGTITFMDEEENILGECGLTDSTATITLTFTAEEIMEIYALYTPASDQYTESMTSCMLTVEKPESVITIETVNLKAGEIATLTATVSNQLKNPLNGGKVSFKINGKTVKDENGKVIYAKLVDGIASVEYAVPISFNGKDINITAVYSGTSKYDKATETITETVAKTTPTITTENVTASAGESITLTANITDGDKQINTGKIVFKINGKSIKDSNGKVIYAKVVNNTVSVEYTLPEDMKAKNYNITAVFISADYDRLEDTKTLTVSE